jgi:hypothetical protein
VLLVLLVPAYVQRQIDRAQIEIGCTSAKANIQQLEALESVARTLGLPDTIEVPSLPEECM